MALISEFPNKVLPNGSDKVLIQSGDTYYSAELENLPGNSSGGGDNSYAILQDRKAWGVFPQTTVANAWTDRQLTTVVADTIGGVSISSGVIINIPPGNYRISVVQAFYDGWGSAIRFVKANDGSVLLRSIGVWFDSGGSITMRGRFSAGAGDSFKLQYITNRSSVQGLGSWVKFPNAEQEIYTDILLEKL
ncbi:hypothetical protein BST81_03560 [Leptolyngbya sp. 'hensonii']|uniref:hypothetical protein n=1 Tax=Leptolyngbya sp. 'hensonii' TaxID=1922337 RepID=UPI00094F52E9|nr:hypothetical protein [Leptolyngbya sp. 'hensonii']OLP19820.1 hypothetical protein BST81_03560 [Leptolyngbya sp. 'hensonii']